MDKKLNITHICFDDEMNNSSEYFVKWRTEDGEIHCGNGLSIIMGINDTGNFCEAARLLMAHHDNTDISELNEKYCLWINVATGEVTEHQSYEEEWFE
jgi:hypothetical protein